MDLLLLWRDFWILNGKGTPSPLLGKEEINISIGESRLIFSFNMFLGFVLGQVCLGPEIKEDDEIEQVAMSPTLGLSRMHKRIVS
ncbi:hypothetical protein ACOSQ2_005101 [Xanthoceras sorbifolium]